MDERYGVRVGVRSTHRTIASDLRGPTMASRVTEPAGMAWTRSSTIFLRFGEEDVAKRLKDTQATAATTSKIYDTRWLDLVRPRTKMCQMSMVFDAQTEYSARPCGIVQPEEPRGTPKPLILGQMPPCCTRGTACRQAPGVRSSPLAAPVDRQKPRPRNMEARSGSDPNEIAIAYDGQTQLMTHRIQPPLGERIDSRGSAPSNNSVRNEEADAETERVEYQTRTPSISPRAGAQAVPEGEASSRERQKVGRTSDRQGTAYDVDQVSKDHVFGGELRGRNQVARPNQATE